MRSKRSWASSIEVGELLCAIDHTFTHFHMTLYAFECRLARDEQSEPRCLGCLDLRWVLPEAAAAFAFPVADQKILAFVRERQPGVAAAAPSQAAGSLASGGDLRGTGGAPGGPYRGAGRLLSRRIDDACSAKWQTVVRPRLGGEGIRGQVLRLALPATAEQMLAMMVGIVDTFLVGHLGATSLASVGLANQWIFLSGTFFGAVGTGSTALIARFIGAKEPDKANQVLRQSVLLGLLIGVVALVMGLSLARPAVTLLGARGEVVGLSSTYLRIVSVALIVAPLMYLGNASLRGAGDTQTPMRIMMVVNVVNIAVAVTAINGLFGVPKMGVAGSALGAATAQMIGGVLVTAVLLKGRGQIRLRLGGMRPDWDVIRRITRVGLPTGVENLLFRIGNMAYVTVLASLGVEAYAANQVAINAWSLSFMPGFGFAVAATTLVGQALGAKEPKTAEQRGYTAYRMGAALMAAMGLMFVLFPAQIMGFFTNDAEVIMQGHDAAAGDGPGPAVPGRSDDLFRRAARSGRYPFPDAHHRRRHLADTPAAGLRAGCDAGLGAGGRLDGHVAGHGHARHVQLFAFSRRALEVDCGLVELHETPHRPDQLTQGGPVGMDAVLDGIAPPQLKGQAIEAVAGQLDQPAHRPGQPSATRLPGRTAC